MSLAHPENDDAEKGKSLASRMRGTGLGGGGVRKSRGSELARIAAVLVLFVLVVAGMVYLQLFSDRAPSPPKDRAKPVIPPLAEDSARWDQMDKKFRDGEERVDVNSEGFLYFLDVMHRVLAPEKVSQMARDDMARLAQRLQEATDRPSKNPESTVAHMLYDYPDICRGKVVRLTGQLTEVYIERLNVTTTSKIEYVYLAAMREKYTSRPVHFYLIQRPTKADGSKFETRTVEVDYGQGVKRAVDVIKNTWVEIEGVFLKTYDYDSEYVRKGVPVKTRAAVLFAKNFREVPAPPVPPDIREGLLYVIAGLAIMIGGVVVFAAVLRRKYREDSLRFKLYQLKKGKSGPEWRSIVE